MFPASILNFQGCVLWLEAASVACRTSSTRSSGAPVGEQRRAIGSSTSFIRDAIQRLLVAARNFPHYELADTAMMALSDAPEVEIAQMQRGKTAAGMRIATWRRARTCG